MQGLSLHYYTVPRDWSDKGSATVFDEQEYFVTLQKALEMETLIKNYSAIMDRYDPQKKVGLMVDEWGNWFNVEPGTNPGFLFQQSTMRDAITCAINLNTFNNNADRVKMANIAQLVNVLQALILTDGPKMILTPTYHVYDMFKVHHNSTLLPIDLKCGNYEIDKNKISELSVSSSRSADGNINITIVNLNPAKTVNLSCEIRGEQVGSIKGKLITASAINSFNTFEKSNEVELKSFTDFKLTDNKINTSIPSKSVILLEIKSK
jgi:alpha-N-arabinofuranosidase